MSRTNSSLIAAVARKPPALNVEHICAIAFALADDLHLEMLHRSRRWNSGPDPFALYREAESRACARIVFALGEVA